MKDIRPAIRALLLADPTVNGLTGGFRVHSARLPQGQVEPSVVFVKVGETADYSQRGDTGLGMVRMQVDSWAQNADAATELANAVYDVLTGFKGNVVYDSTSLDFRGTYMEAGREDYDDIMLMFRVSRDFFVWYDIR